MPRYHFDADWRSRGKGGRKKNGAERREGTDEGEEKGTRGRGEGEERQEDEDTQESQDNK